ncbi:3-deoxy-manno-octulosonate cytidylyltransferase [hydrothermal vent metagenome]|uniref:3-deoxy-manno-octulosonate cytidylyltransferase n=1 Tax=hydrothermal vent metagenome TaxID=652676 RepID=A0A3B0TEX7_9ZZZZ
MSNNPTPSGPTMVMIPARRAATRLPGKPLAEIAGEPMIVHVWRRAVEADLGPVLVATDDDDIVACVAAAGGRAVLTDPGHPSGSDRIYEALQKVDPEGRVKIVVNLQGDLPNLDPVHIRRCAALVASSGADIGTLVAEIHDDKERHDPSVVKAITAFENGADEAVALYFTRATAPTGAGPLWHHIGIYTYTRSALARFVSLPPSPLERREKLEQLRALEAGMTIRVARVDTVPIGVDTPADLDEARAVMTKKP